MEVALVRLLVKYNMIYCLGKSQYSSSPDNE